MKSKSKKMELNESRIGINRALLNFVLWIITAGLLSVLLLIIDYYDTTIKKIAVQGQWQVYFKYSNYTWAPQAAVSIGIMIFILATVITLRKYVKLSKTIRINPMDRITFDYILWILISCYLSAILISITYITDFDLAIPTAIGISIFSFNLASGHALKYYVENHERNIVAWTTAIVIFSPFVAGLVYLLTWPKNQKLIVGEGDRK